MHVTIQGVSYDEKLGGEERFCTNIAHPRIKGGNLGVRNIFRLEIENEKSPDSRATLINVRQDGARIPVAISPEFVGGQELRERERLTDGWVFRYIV